MKKLSDLTPEEIRGIVKEFRSMTTDLKNSPLLEACDIIESMLHVYSKADRYQNALYDAYEIMLANGDPWHIISESIDMIGK